MAGSLNHIVDENGALRLDLIENMGDAFEALVECFDVIATLCVAGLMHTDPLEDLNGLMRMLNYPDVKAVPIVGRRAEVDF